MERVGACEVGKVDGGTACWGPVLVSGERSGLTSVRRVKRTSVLKERCKRTFVEMPRNHAATCKREYKHAFFCSRVPVYIR